MNSIKITAAFANRKPLKGWSRISGLTRDQATTLGCITTTRECADGILFATRDLAEVKARFGI